MHLASLIALTSEVQRNPLDLDKTAYSGLPGAEKHWVFFFFPLLGFFWSSWSLDLLPSPSQGMHQQDISCSVLYDKLAYGNIAWPLLSSSGVTCQVRSGCLLACAS